MKGFAKRILTYLMSNTLIKDNTCYFLKHFEINEENVLNFFFKSN